MLRGARRETMVVQLAKVCVCVNPREVSGSGTPVPLQESAAK